MENEQNHNLATIEKIIDIQPIEGADRIECLFLLGYKTVAQKGLYKVNDKVIFIRPDSLVPKTPPFEFLFKDVKVVLEDAIKLIAKPIDPPPVRIITRRFKKCVSQGLVLPLNVLAGISTENLVVGCSVDSILGIKKFEKEVTAALAGTVKGNFPSFLKKTNQENLRSFPAVYEELKNNDIVTSIKYDGTSSTFYFKDGLFGVCSRNLELKEDDNNIYWKMAKKYDLENKLKQFGFNVAIQAECYGPGIQNNKMDSKEINIAVFDIFDIDRFQYLDHDMNYRDLLLNYDLPTVFQLNRGDCPSLENLLQLANETKYSNGEWAEGIVINSVKERYSNVLDTRLSVKIINENFCLKFKE